ncbi:hypothetical protein AVHY2522_04490 [Acidovorax sp. SUPP2522]|nr:hypothetical protein AVMA1855_23250 [Acidovorax sp. SUPP1855]GKT14411.1 hypothetical protein AVHY2522_04490 [Acidovorax sp. SUPP2522]
MTNIRSALWMFSLGLEANAQLAKQGAYMGFT